MYKKTLKYTDYNGEEVVKDFYFNLSKAELMAKEFSMDGGLSNYVDRIQKEKDMTKLMQLFADLIDWSYGMKGADGGFYKSEEILAKFKATQAYSDIYISLATDDNEAAAFINNVVPKDVVDEAQAQRLAEEEAGHKLPQDHKQPGKVTPINK